MQRFHFMIYFWVTLSIKKDDSLNPSSSLKVLWKPLTIDFTWIYCTVIIIALSPHPLFPTRAHILPLLKTRLRFFKIYASFFSQLV